MCVCVCVSDDSVSFMSEFHEVWYPDMIGWVSGCGQFHIESSKFSPRRGVVNARWSETQRRILSLVPIIVVVACCCIFIINYCWQTSRASFAFGLSQMLTFHINLRSVETKRVAARCVVLLLALVLAWKVMVSRGSVLKKSKKRRAIFSLASFWLWIYSTRWTWRRTGDF